MTLPMLQIMIGIGVGLLGFLLLRNQAIEAPRMATDNGRRQRKSDYDYSDFIPHSKPGDMCVICMQEMRLDRDMRYLRCGHALHEDCLERARMYCNQCPLCRQKM